MLSAPDPTPLADPGGRRRAGRGGRHRLGAVAATGDDDDALVIYNGRSHYGDEQVFEDFSEATGIKVELRGGTGPELFERLRREGDDTPADVLVTTDLANLWRAEDAGLLQPVDTPDPRGEHPRRAPRPRRGTGGRSAPGCAIPVVSTERVPRARSPATRTSATRGSRAAPACAPRTTSTTSRSSPT